MKPNGLVVDSKPNTTGNLRPPRSLPSNFWLTAVSSASLPHSLLPINFLRKFRNEIQQRPPTQLSQHRSSSLGSRIRGTRLPGRQDDSSTERSSIQPPLRTQTLLT